jgi:hypothetical protein
VVVIVKSPKQAEIDMVDIKQVGVDIDAELVVLRIV